MQVDPIEATLKAPGTKCLNLQYDEPLSNFGLKFNLRRHILDIYDGLEPSVVAAGAQGELNATASGSFTAGAYTRPLLSST